MPLGTPKSTQETISIPHGVCMITTQVNGGSLAIDVLHAPSPEVWVPATAVMVADGAVTLYTAPGARIRLTPAGGATWNVQAPGL